MRLYNLVKTSSRCVGLCGGSSNVCSNVLKPMIAASTCTVLRRYEAAGYHVHESPTQHPQSTFGRDSFQSGITPDKRFPPHTDMSNAGTGVLVLPEDQLPGDYPVTAEDWIKSARKYGIPIEEYEPYADDGVTSRGDYPAFKPTHCLSRDYWYEWDMPVYKGNWGHVLHYDEMELLAFNNDNISPTLDPLWKMTLKFLSTLFGAVAVCVISIVYFPYHGVAKPKVYCYGWDPHKQRFYPEREQIMYRFPEHAPNYS